MEETESGKGKLKLEQGRHFSLRMCMYAILDAWPTGEDDAHS